MERLKPKHIVLTCYYRHKPGGLCKRLTRTMSALVERDAEVHYISATEFPVKHPNCHFHRFPWIGKNYDNPLFWAFFLLLTPFYAFYLTLTFRINRIFVFEPTYAFLLQPLRALKKIPLKVFFRADSIENYTIKGRHPIFIWLAQKVEKIGVGKSSVYAVSEHCLNRVISRHGSSKLNDKGVLRNDIPRIDPIKGKSKLSRPLELSCAGILEKRKNQEFLIRLLPDLDKDSFKLNIYGIGPSYSKLVDLSKELGVEKMVVFHGWKDISTILKNSNLILIPSLHEGAPNTVLEAIATDTPLLASNIEEHREILPDSTTLPLQKELWLKRLTAIIDNPATQLKKITTDLEESKSNLSFNWDKRITDFIFSHNSAQRQQT